jgi:heme/copper-type cytochrome/quinol oxidase subunit 4
MFFSMSIVQITIFLLCFLQTTMDLANKHSNNPESLKILFSSLTLICKIFYSLNSQVNALALICLEVLASIQFGI